MRLNAIMGVPDDRRIKISLNPKSARVTYTYPGTTSFTPLLSHPNLDWNLVWVGPDEGEVGAARPDPDLPTINFLADADLYTSALARSREQLGLNGVPIFNSPERIQQSTRDGISRQLQGIPGLDVPRAIRVAPTSPTELWDAIAENELSYPVLIRVAGTHSGMTVVKVDDPGDDAALHAVPWGGRTLYAIEFVERREADGRFSKVRLFAVGGRWFMRHWVVGDAWSVHVWNSTRGAPEIARETERLESFEFDLAPRLAPTLNEIDRRLGLDFFGMDCFIGQDDMITLYEANACMRLFLNLEPSPNRWDAPIRAGYTELLKVLADSARWKATSGAPA